MLTDLAKDLKASNFTVAFYNAPMLVKHVVPLLTESCV